MAGRLSEPPAATPSAQEAAALRRRLTRWYRCSGRHELDWRRTRDPYAVLVSEVMLQQTQVERVLPYYRAWLARWPSFAALAAAGPAEAIRAWAGLGYNRRALHLHRAAGAAAARDGDRLSLEELRALPGVGPYTAAAVACFCHDERLPVLETNVKRVIARAVLGVSRPDAARPSELDAAAWALLPSRGARDHNLALMDLGALVCRARPGCDACPLRGACVWLWAGRPEAGRRQRKGERFEDTARFARGRIMALLRETEAPLSADDVARALPEAHQASTTEHLLCLEREGLAAFDGQGWSLPVAAQSGAGW